MTEAPLPTAGAWHGAKSGPCIPIFTGKGSLGGGDTWALGSGAQAGAVVTIVSNSSGGISRNGALLVPPFSELSLFLPY